MSYPTLTKSGVTTVTFSRGPSYPSDHVYTPSQVVGISEAGTVRVATLRVPEETLLVVFERVPQADVTALLAFLNNALVNWAAHTITYTDVDGTAWTVRVLDASFTRSQVAFQLYTVKLTLRREIA